MIERKKQMLFEDILLLFDSESRDTEMKREKSREREANHDMVTNVFILSALHTANQF